MSDGADSDLSQLASAARGRSAAPDARERVLDCAGGLLEESGPEGLTIRRLAASSGFTPPAIYSLFGDKAGLIEALVQRTFARLAEVVGAIEKTGLPRDYARRAYLEIVRYGRKHPHQFRLLEERLPATTTVGGPSLEQWRERMPTPLFDGAGLDTDLVRQMFWSLLHGLVTLPPVRPDVAWRDDLAGYAFDAMLQGLMMVQEGEGGAGE